MLAAIDLKATLGITFAGAGVLLFVFGYLLARQNREVKKAAADAVRLVADAQLAYISKGQRDLMALAELKLPNADDIEKLLKALPEEDRAVGAFIIGGLASFVLALLAAGFVTFGTG